MVVYQWSPFLPFKFFLDFFLGFLIWAWLLSGRKGDREGREGRKEGEKDRNKNKGKKPCKESREVADRWIAEWKEESFGNSWNERKDELDNLNEGWEGGVDIL